jgi:hypothetical protein
MRPRIALIVILASLALAVTACGRTEKPLTVRFETSGSAITSKAAEALAASTDISAFASVTSTDAPALRTTMLGQLRARGDAGARAAELLTAGFPVSTPSVPVLVQVRPVDGVSAILVVEAYGDAGGTLTHRRLWVFDRVTGAMMRAASFY